MNIRPTYFAALWLAVLSLLVLAGCGGFGDAEGADENLLIFPEGAIAEPISVSGNNTSLIRAFDQGWDLWAPEN